MARKKVRLGSRSPWKLRWQPMEPERKRLLLRDKGEKEPTPERQRLREGLLAFGGDFVLIPHVEEDLAAILTRGELRSGRGAHLEPGSPSQCHSNVSQLYESNEGNPDGRIAIATGYALSRDGLWRQHSWGVWYDEGSPSGLLVETTERRVAYFGFEMTSAEAESFSANNLW